MGGGKHPPVDEEESNKSQFMGAGYRTKRGVINLELGPEVVTMTSLMEECTLSSKSWSLLRKHQTTHRHWSVEVTATILTMRMTTPHQQDEDMV